MNYMGRRYICVERSSQQALSASVLFAKTIAERKRAVAVLPNNTPGTSPPVMRTWLQRRLPP
jgi:hypothetical protein